MKRIFALILAAALLLTGCASMSLREAFDVVKFGDMVYTRPDLAALEQVLENSCALAAEGTDVDAVLDGVWDFYDAYDAFYTAYCLANVRCDHDLTDEYWQEEYAYCIENAPAVDAALEKLYCALADSPLRQELEAEYFGYGFFDGYEGDPIWDEGLLALLDRESALINEYYDLSAQALEEEYYSEAFFAQYAPALGQLLADLIAVRQEQAAYVGYGSYAEFAYDFYHYRDYTPAQAGIYLEELKQTLVPVYEEVNASDVWSIGYEWSTERQNLDYVRQAAKAMGGLVEEAFTLLEAGELYDIAPGENKFDTAYELYFPSYYQPFIFMKPTGTVYDRLSLAHEFGHFANDYVCGGSYSGVDVAEVFSQGMEYLSLCYTPDSEDLEKLKMADSLCAFVESGAYAAFELEAYELTGEDLTAENLFALYERICTEFGFGSWDWDSRDMVLVSHFYTEPMYVISYVVSNDTAMQIYQLEREEPGAGLALYEENLGSWESYLLTFAADAGLESPFAPGRLEKLKETFEAVLG